MSKSTKPEYTNDTVSYDEIKTLIDNNDIDMLQCHQVGPYVADVHTNYGWQSYMIIQCVGGYVLYQDSSNFRETPAIAAEYIGVKLSKTKLLKIAREYFQRCRSSLKERYNANEIDERDYLEYPSLTREAIKDIIAL